MFLLQFLPLISTPKSLLLPPFCSCSNIFINTEKSFIWDFNRLYLEWFRYSYPYESSHIESKTNGFRWQYVMSIIFYHRENCSFYKEGSFNFCSCLSSYDDLSRIWPDNKWAMDVKDRKNWKELKFLNKFQRVVP